MEVHNSRKTSLVTYKVWPTPAHHKLLEPITLEVRTGAISLQDYLTAEHARKLAAGLLVAADMADGSADREASPTFDDIVDAKLAEVKFIEIPA